MAGEYVGEFTLIFIILLQFFTSSCGSPEPERLRKRYVGTEDLRYNDSVCYQRFSCKIEFAIIKKLDRIQLKHQ